MECLSLKEWLDNHYMTYTIRKDVLVIPEFGRCLIMDDYEHIFKLGKDGEVQFNTPENYAYLEADDIFYIVFPFGVRWYYIDIRDESCQFKVLRYVGKKPEFEHTTPYYPLGIHSGYELLNGSGLLKDWCTKARFLGYEGLSVCDRNTLASSLELQTSASSKGLKFCFGYSLTIKAGNDRVGAKVYACTQRGFRNLLRIQKDICVDHVDTKEIEAISLLNLADGNVLVFDKWSGEWLAANKGLLEDFVKAFDGWVFFQVDVSEYKADRIDSQLLISHKAYFDNFFILGGEYQMNIRPVLIQDAYYLDKEDCMSKIVLNKIDTGAAHEQSSQQYMKTIDELYEDFRNIFSDNYGDVIFEDMCYSTVDIIENATACYDLTENYAPKYDMTEEEKRKYGDTLNMFHQLIEEGFRRLVPDGMEQIYRDRIEYEKYVIESTDNVDYFLIQRDQVNWAAEHGILTGIGRGSAGGSLALFLLGVTFIDPIRYNLLFERFLLPERAGLEPAEVTKLQPNVQSEEYYEIELENGQTIRFDKDAEFKVKRNGELMIVYADELQPDDDIIWDRCDELFYLERINQSYESFTS